MIVFGTLSITLLIGAGQGAVLALMLLFAPTNVVANRFLAFFILAVASMVTPYIIGFAGFYDAYPWLSFAPFSTGLAFGPLFYFYCLALTGGQLPERWRLHFAPYAVQFLAQALVFPLPLAAKNWWDDVAYAPVISPALTIASLVSVALYARLAWQRYSGYREFLEANRTDGAVFDPAWIRNALLAVGGMGFVWGGFFLADMIDPSRNYFDRFWMYVGLCFLAIYLGVEGWRNARLSYPELEIKPVQRPSVTAPSDVTTDRDWSAQANAWASEVDVRELWRDPDLTLASLAKSLGTNTTYLSKALNEGLGVTFSAFVNGRRVDEVKRQLADANVSADILTIAMAAGFNSKASFNRAFGAIVGTTPSAFRREAGLKP